MSATDVTPEGITSPPIDELLKHTTSKYALVIFAAKRARQINSYYSQLGEGLLEYVGPLVEPAPQEKALSIALREIDSGLLVSEPIEPGSLAVSTIDGGTVEPAADRVVTLGEAAPFDPDASGPADA